MAKKRDNSKIFTYIIILGIILVAIVILYSRSSQSTDAEVTKCIGEKAIMYSQVGCIHCLQQLQLFGDNQKFLNVFDCNSDNWQTCQTEGVPGTPTWKINEELYIGKQSIEKLKQLTGC